MGNSTGNKTKSSANNYGRVVKYLGIFGGAQGVSVLLAMLRNKVAFVLLGAMGFGLIALYNRTVQLFCDFTGLSLSLSAVRRMSDAYSNEDENSVRHCVKVVRSIALLTGLVGMFLMLSLSPLVSQFTFDGDGYYTLRLALLSPVVLFVAVSGGELAILRGVKQPGKIALYTLWTACSAVLATIPLYFLFGVGGVFPSIFLVALLQMAGALFFSTKLYAYRANPFSYKLLREGLDIIKLGAGYIYASMLVSGAMWLVYQAVTRIGGEDAIEIFSAGYLLVGMLPSILFAAFDSDYYPRLSGIFARKDERNAMVNEHIEAHLLIQVPVIFGVVLLLPWLFPLFFSQEVMPALQMTQIAVLALLFHIMTYPISFLPVSKGDTVTFALQETLYNVAFVSLTVFGYSHYGWLGAGIGMVVARVIDLSVVYSIARLCYGFRLSGRALLGFVQAVTAASVIVLSIFCAGYYPWLQFAGFAVAALMVVLSLYRLSRSGNIMTSILKRIFKKFK
ncbi:MAG: oligosaccharide flippase family protein [Bacteroidaceae bacterium]|nr:oligosaccharide flippase family protein [Bacteroidaceae bacterium]